MPLTIVPDDERRLQAELPELLDALAGVAGWIGALDIAKAADVPAESLAELRDVLLRALEIFHELFAYRGQPPPEPQPGVAFGSLGPSLRRTLPQRLAAQLADELNAVPSARLEDLSEFTALGLFALVTDLLRFVRFVEDQRTAAARAAAPPTVVALPRPKAVAAARPPAPPAPAPAPPATPEPPSGAGPDLSSYEIRIDEAGERVDADGISVWFAASAGPRAVGAGLAAAFAVEFPGGVALAVAEGLESSLGARLAAVVAARTFCRVAALKPAEPGAAVATAQNHLEMLLSALLAAGDASAAMTSVRGSVSAANARRILRHTRQPEEALRRVAPALATGLLGAVAQRTAGGVRVTLHRLGAATAEARAGGRVVSVLGPPADGAASFLGPGVLGEQALGRVEAPPPFVLAPSDALLVASPALARGAPSAWAGLATLWAPFPDGLATGDTVRDLLRRAERWGEAEPPSFAGPLGLGLLLAR